LQDDIQAGERLRPVHDSPHTHDATPTQLKRACRSRVKSS
jgi:hypothetical protein